MWAASEINHCVSDWNIDGDLSMPTYNNIMGAEKELTELLWKNGELILNTQTHKKHMTTNLIPQNDPISWIQNQQLDNPFETRFCSNIFQELDPRPPMPPPPRSSSYVTEEGETGKCSVITVGSGSAYCGSNHVADLNRTSSSGFGTAEDSACTTILPRFDRDETMREPDITSTSGGSGGSSSGRTCYEFSGTNTHKRKNRDHEESKSQFEAAGLENKQSQQSRNVRKTRTTQVHNLSERRRRDRINEKMRVLQELIPYSSKSDKASMLDEAIEYLKTLQLQLQMMCMGSGMASSASMMYNQGVQYYASRMGMGPIHGPMQLARVPLAVNQAVSTVPCPNQGSMSQQPLVLNSVIDQNQLSEQYARYVALHSMQNASQSMNIFGYGPHGAPQYHTMAARAAPTDLPLKEVQLMMP